MEQIDIFFNANIFSYRLKTLLKRTILLILLLCISIFINGQKMNISVNFDLNNFKIEKIDSLNSIQYVKNFDVRYFLPVGYPKLPYIPFFILLPHNSRIERILIDDFKLEAIEGYYNIISATFEDIDSDSSYSVNTQSLKNNKMDHLKNHYPSDIQIVMYNSPELYAGFLVNKINICPIKYFPETRQLFIYTKLLLDIQYQIDEKPLKYELSEDKIKASRRFIRDLVINKEEIDKTVPLEEKIDYSIIQINKETKEDTVELKKKESILLKKEEKGEPFHIKRLKTN